MGKNWKDKSDFLGKTNNTAIIDDSSDILTKDISQKRLLISKFLSIMRKEQFSSYEFFIGTQISDIKYKHLESKYQSSFYPFNNQLNYALAHYFAKSMITKDNINKYLTDLLMVPLTKKLSYTNTDEQIEKLSEILQGISENKWTKYKFDVESGIPRIARQEIGIQL